MRDYRDAKLMAAGLRQALADKSLSVTHSESLELIARAFGLDNWNILAAKIEAAPKRSPTGSVQPAAADGEKPALHCSFCGKSQYDVASLIAGPAVFICDECVGLCDGILLDGRLGRLMADAQHASGDADEAAGAAMDSIRALDDERLRDFRRGEAAWLEHIEWELAQMSAAIEGRPTSPWRGDAAADRRTRDPLAGKSPDQIRAKRKELEERLPQVRRRLAIVDEVLRERGAPGAGQGPAGAA